MDIEQAMRAMAPLSEEEQRLALGVEEPSWPPPLTQADRKEARAARFATWISEEEGRALFPRATIWITKPRRDTKVAKREDREGRAVPPRPLGEGRGEGGLGREDTKR